VAGAGTYVSYNMDDKWSQHICEMHSVEQLVFISNPFIMCHKKRSKNIPHQQHWVKTQDRRWKPFKSQVQYWTRLKYKNVSFFSDKAWFPLSRNVNCLTDTDSMDIPMTQFIKFLYMTFQLRVNYNDCTPTHTAYIFHHLPFKGQAFGLFCLHNAHLFLGCPTSLLP